MRVAIAGCGQFSRAHISALQKIQGLEIVAVCDQDPWRAREVAGLTRGAQAYGDLEAMLQRAHPNVVHILTPPATHASLAIQAIQAGCHVLVEKPMALNIQEADRMIEAAQAHGVKLSTNHNYLFNPCILRACQLVKHGTIGQVIYVEGYYGLSETGGYTSIAGRSHWAWRLPGSAFTNFLPHLIYLLLEFLPEEASVAGVTMTQGARFGEPPTELAVLLRGGTSASGAMTISMRARPYAKFLNLYGTQGIIHADLATDVCTLHRAQRLPGMITKVLFNLEESAQLATGTIVNTARVAMGILTRDPGLHGHLREFYARLREDKELPVSGEDGKRMVAIMEQVWAKTPTWPSRPTAPSSTQMPAGPRTVAENLVAERGFPGKVLVTGGTGFLGHHLVLALARCGAHVVALVRDKSRVSADLLEQAEVVCGDLRDPSSIEDAMRGVSIAYHCAAVTSNNIPWQTHHEVNVAGTEAVFKEALKAGVKRVIHVSSVVVYGLRGSSNGGRVGETTPLPDQSDRWAHYHRSKLAADKLAIDYWRRSGLPVTVLRLGILYGPGGRPVKKGLVQLGSLVFTIGTGRNRLPYTYVGNAVDCLLLAALSQEAVGQIFNVLDGPQPTAREFQSESAAISGDRLVAILVPPSLLLGMGGILEWRNRLSGSDIPPKLSRFVVRSACRDICYETTRAREQLGWHQEIVLADGLRRTLSGS